MRPCVRRWTLSAVAVFTALISRAQLAEPLGVVEVSIAAGAARIVAMPFMPFEAPVAQVLAGQLQDGDRVRKWDAAAQRYVAAQKLDGVWREEGDVERPSAMTLGVGEAFWIENRQAAEQTVWLCGRIALQERSPMAARPGLNLLGYPFSTAMALGRTEMWRVTAPPEAGLGAAAATDVLSLAGGFWFGNNGTGALCWLEPRPYAPPGEAGETEPADAGASLPRVGAMSAGAAAVVLQIACSGAPGERLDIFRKELSATNLLDLASGWSLAAADLSSDGVTNLTWSEAGAIARPPGASVAGRCYLVTRADVDLNGDGVPDARERLLGDRSSAGGSGVSGGPSSTPAAAQADGAEEDRALSGLGSARTIYVDAALGDDARAGLSRLATPSDGPKRTINAALRAAQPGDTVLVNEGTYDEQVNFSGVTLVTSGEVTIR